MTEQLMTLGQEITIRDETRLQMGAALSNHVTAKNIAHIDELRQVDTIQRILAIARTREGLAALEEILDK